MKADKFLSDAKCIILCLTCEFDIEPCNSQYGSCNRSNMAAQSGSTFISQTMIDSVEILTTQALQNFNKALPNDRDNDRLRYSVPVLFSVTHCQCKCIYVMEWKCQNNIFAIVCHSNKCVLTYRKSMSITVLSFYVSVGGIFYHKIFTVSPEL